MKASSFAALSLPPMLLIGSLVPKAPADCIDYATHLRWVAEHRGPFTGYSAVDGQDGLLVYGSISFFTYYVEVLDTSTQATSSVIVDDEVWSIAIDGDYAYAVTPSRLTVVDVSDPALATITGTLALTDLAADVAVGASHAYLATSGGVVVVDISDPANPAVAGTVSGIFATAVDVEGSLAVVSTLDSRIGLYDLTIPEAPAPLGSLTTPGRPRAVALSGSYAFVAGDPPSPGVLAVVDISDPLVPELVASVADPTTGQGLRVMGDHILVASTTDLIAIDVSQVENPVVTGTMGGGMRDVAVIGSTAYAVTGGSLREIDVTFMTSPEALGGVDTPGEAMAVVTSGHHAFIADGSSGLQVADVSDPTAPVLVGSAATPGTALDVAVAGNDVLVADAGGGLRIFDVTDPTNPTPIATVPTPLDARNVVAEGPIACVSAGLAGLLIIDVSDPAAPVVLSTIDDDIVGVDLEGSLLCYGVDLGGMRLVDVSDPSQPNPLADFSCCRGTASIEGDRVYAIVDDAWSEGYAPRFQLFDISTPQSPVELADVPAPSMAGRLAVDGQVIYGANGDLGLSVWDVSEMPASLIGSAAVGDRLPDWPFHGVASGVSVAHDVVFIASGEAGVIVLPRQCTTAAAVAEPDQASPRLALRLAGPNPVGRGGTPFALELPDGAPARVIVYDALGRAVREVVDQYLTAGLHVLSWDGRDDRGTQVSRGVYFVRLSTPSESAVERVVLVP